MNTISTKDNNTSVSELKHLTLSIDRGITDDLNQQIIRITDYLGQQWQNDKILSTLVKMVRALSEYTASGKSNINAADSITLIGSIVLQIENLSSSKGVNLPIAKKQAILSEEIAKYNKLKQQIKSVPKASSVSYSSTDTGGNIIAELKSIILSLDWEITDELIQSLDKEVQRLQTHWQNSKIHLSFLQMFRSIGNYVLSKGSNTHPDSISLLNSLYRSFEMIVTNPSMKVAQQKEILLREMKKFNDLKQLISSAKISKPRRDLNVPDSPSAYGGVSPMDDLIGTKNSSNLSPVDDLIEEIHMLQDSGDRTHSMDSNRASHGSGSANTNPEIKEIIPNRLKKQPIEEIQTRLDAFFDEDEPLSELAFADSGEEVVPYKSDKEAFSSYAEVAPAEQLSDNDAALENTEDISFEDETPLDMNEIELTESLQDISATSSNDSGSISFEDYDDTKKQQSPDFIQPVSKSDSTSDGMVPYDFENEIFEEEELKIESDAAFLNSSNESTEVKTLLEELKSTVGRCMFHGSAKELKEINDKIKTLEQLWNEEPSKLILLKMVKSLAGYFDLLAPAPDEQNLELMLYIVESMENSASNSVSDSNRDKNESNTDIIDLFSKYIDFQNKIVKKDISAGSMADIPEKTLKSEIDYSDIDGNPNLLGKEETLADKEILYDKTIEETSDVEKKMTEPTGLWSKIKKWLGL